MHPLRSNLHTLFTNTSRGLFDVSDRLDVCARFGRHVSGILIQILDRLLSSVRKEKDVDQINKPWSGGGFVGSCVFSSRAAARSSAASRSHQ